MDRYRSWKPMEILFVGYLLSLIPPSLGNILDVQCSNGSFFIRSDLYIYNFTTATPSFLMTSQSDPTNSFYLTTSFDSISELASNTSTTQWYSLSGGFEVTCWQNTTLVNSTDADNSTAPNLLIDSVSILFEKKLLNNSAIQVLLVMANNTAMDCFSPNYCLNLTGQALQAHVSVSSWEFNDPLGRLVLKAEIETSIGVLDVGASFYSDTGNPESVSLSTLNAALSDNGEIEYENGTIAYRPVDMGHEIDSYSPIHVTLYARLPPNSKGAVKFGYDLAFQTIEPKGVKMIFIIIGVVAGVFFVCILGIVVFVFYKKFPELRQGGSKDESSEPLTDEMKRKSMKTINT
eukprot:TRINITY_DN6112_c0_g1_i1.p1 TRINITY_DN6112_c0_g1~~TRINITY_DN6112_c0_g1_i1.p1  ORF type:complete len:347 (+),score=57.79 TRINITY_DN6112_c0_g1_i1:97-1137(+)